MVSLNQIFFENFINHCCCFLEYPILNESIDEPQSKKLVDGTRATVILFRLDSSELLRYHPLAAGNGWQLKASEEG